MDSTFSCSQCPSVWANQDLLDKHILNRHTEHECDVCKKTFPFSSTLINHKRSHTGEKPFKCDVCNKPFTTNSGLYHHKKRHTEGKAFQCYVCYKTFLTRSNLLSHIIIHTDEKPYQCDVCGNHFVRNSELISHKIIHTGHKLFQCGDCDRTFYRVNNLNTHRRESHKKKSSKDSITGINSKEFIKHEIKAEETIDEDPLLFQVETPTFIKVEQQVDVEIKKEIYT